MKKVICSFEDCWKRRIHFEEPDTPRGPQWIEVKDDHEGPAYCSLSCAVQDGAISLNRGYCGPNSI